MKLPVGLLLRSLHPMVNFVVVVVKLLVNAFKVYSSLFQIVICLFIYFIYLFFHSTRQGCHNKCTCLPVLKVAKNILEIDNEACQICK